MGFTPCAFVDEVGRVADGISQDADAGNSDLDDVSGLEREVGRRDEARAGEEDAARGTGFSRTSQSASSANERRICAVDVSPAKRSAPSASVIRHADRERLVESSGTSTAGPSAHAPAKIFACGR